jgi:hypothetical protein
VFHQLVAGKSGGGPGRLDSSRGVIAAAAAARTAEIQEAKRGGAASSKTAAADRDLEMRVERDMDVGFAIIGRPPIPATLSRLTAIADSRQLSFFGTTGQSHSPRRTA